MMQEATRPLWTQRASAAPTHSAAAAIARTAATPCRLTQRNIARPSVVIIVIYCPRQRWNAGRRIEGGVRAVQPIPDMRYRRPLRRQELERRSGKYPRPGEREEMPDLRDGLELATRAEPLQCPRRTLQERVAAKQG